MRATKCPQKKRSDRKSKTKLNGYVLQTFIWLIFLLETQLPVKKKSSPSRKTAAAGQITHCQRASTPDPPQAGAPKQMHLRRRRKSGSKSRCAWFLLCVCVKLVFRDVFALNVVPAYLSSVIYKGYVIRKRDAAQTACTYTSPEDASSSAPHHLLAFPPSVVCVMLSSPWDGGPAERNSRRVELRRETTNRYTVRGWGRADSLIQINGLEREKGAINSSEAGHRLRKRRRAKREGSRVHAFRDLATPAQRFGRCRKRFQS